MGFCMAKKCAVGMLGAALLPIWLALGCVDPEGEGGGSTAGTSLYVFDASDGATNRVLVYTDMAALFNDPANAAPSRQLRGDIINTVQKLAWGGMCFDANGNRLYMVSETGFVVRIERARSQNGTITNQNEIKSFRLGSESDRLPNGTFGQAAIDPRGNYLYVTESNNSDARIWAIASPHTIEAGTSVSSSGQIMPMGDNGGTGVAAGSDGSVYAFFEGGYIIPNLIQGIQYTGPRLRKGTASAFLPEGVVIGETGGNNRTMLAKYGSLAVDSSGYVFFARHLAEAGLGSAAPILIFRPGQFSPGWNQAPDKTFGDTNNLRVISHAITRDWLVGALSLGDSGMDTVCIWRAPSLGPGSSYNEFRVGQGVSIRGLALDGSN
jgi:hypothetical protein